MTDFQRDLKTGKKGEQTVYNYLLSLGLDVEDTSDIPEYYYKGDFKINLPTGAVFLDAKVDNVMYKSQRIFAEEEVTIKETGKIYPGDMQKDYDYMAFVSYPEGKIYFYDAKILREIYKKGDLDWLEHPQTVSKGRFVPHWLASKYHALLGKVEF